VLGFQSVDAGEGWLIFALPPAELGIHPGDGQFVECHADHELSGSVIYLMCDDLPTTMEMLKKKGAETTAIVQAGWEPPQPFVCRAAVDWGCISLGMPRHWNWGPDHESR
jgi:hypothetical protein